MKIAIQGELGSFSHEAEPPLQLRCKYDFVSGYAFRHTVSAV